MLAISVREAIRDAIAAFGRAGGTDSSLLRRHAGSRVLGHPERARACATTPESCRSVDSGVVSAARVPALLRAERSE